MKYDIVLVMDLYSLSYHNKNNFNIIRALIIVLAQCVFCRTLVFVKFTAVLKLRLREGPSSEGKPDTRAGDIRAQDTRAKSSKGRH